MSKSTGPLETRPWLNDGLFLGFVSNETEKVDYSDNPDESYDKRVGRVVLVRNEVITERDEDGNITGHKQVREDFAGPFLSEVDAKTWAEEE